MLGKIGYKVRKELLSTLGISLKGCAYRFFSELRKTTNGDKRKKTCEEVFAVNVNKEDFVCTPTEEIRVLRGDNENLRVQNNSLSARLHEVVKARLSVRETSYKPYRRVKKKQKKRQLEMIRYIFCCKGIFFVRLLG